MAFSLPVHPFTGYQILEFGKINEGDGSYYAMNTIAPFPLGKRLRMWKMPWYVRHVRPVSKPRSL